MKSSVRNSESSLQLDQTTGKKKKIHFTILSFFLKDLDDGRIPDLVLKELLIFVTGADAVPPPGFTSALPISFYDMENDVKRLPYTSTCNMSLSVARGLQEPKNFNELMYGTTLGCFGFGKC